MPSRQVLHALHEVVQVEALVAGVDTLDRVVQTKLGLLAHLQVRIACQLCISLLDESKSLLLVQDARLLLVSCQEDIHELVLLFSAETLILDELRHEADISLFLSDSRGDGISPDHVEGTHDLGSQGLLARVDKHVIFAC